jgi:hypothetical protein
MKAICPQGHETTISWCNLKKGQGCRYCAGNIRFEYEEVAQYFGQHGCKLLEENYQNNDILMSFRCSCGAVSKVRFRDFKSGRRCIHCKFDRLADHFRTPFQEVEAFFRQHGATLLAETYKDNRTKMPYICKCGSVSSATYSNFQKCPNCKKCGNLKVSGSNCYMWNPDREAIKRNAKYRKICNNILARALGIASLVKGDHTYTLLGYHARDLQEHIHRHPNYQGEKWMQVDHIFPIKAFMDYQIYDLKFINRLDNLQPLYGTGNQEKADKYDRTEFERWLKANGLLLTH